MVPALVAFAGSIYGLFSLTLGQDPSNALPHWSPVTGWSITLGALGLATVLVWIALVRRKCPDCGSTQMLDAMEEEGLTASERLAAQKAAVDDARAGLARQPLDAGGRELRADIEAELRSSHAKETADKLAALEKELRPRLEQELREMLEQRLRAEHERHGAEHERVLRKKVEEELRPSLERELRPQLEEKLRSEIEKQVRASLEKPLPEPKPLPMATTPAPVKETPSAIPAAAKPITHPPTTAARAIGSSPLSTAAAKPITPPPTTTAKAIASSTASSAAAKPITPAPTTTAKAIASATTFGFPAAAKPITPAPTTTAKAITSSVTPQVVALPVGSRPVIGTPTPALAPSTAPKTAQPAAPHAKVETMPLSLMFAESRSLGRATPATRTVQAPQPGVASSVVARSAVPLASEQAATAPGGETKAEEPAASHSATDVHERAKRRARVILSDLSLYHRGALLKAAHGTDAKLELGTLWRDAVISYNEAVPPDVRDATNYLEEELERNLSHLRQA